MPSSVCSELLIFHRKQQFATQTLDLRDVKAQLDELNDQMPWTHCRCSQQQVALARTVGTLSKWQASAGETCAGRLCSVLANTRTATLLFTDLVNSTELLGRAGDERAQQIFRAHHKLLSDAVVAHGGHEVKWLGDGLMVAFPSAADAVRCAIAMQQSGRRPVAGARLG